nr:hypothetical protein [Tanacetum cinerariifolium]
MHENFSATSTTSLDSIFNRLQKIVSWLSVLGEFISQEDSNLKFLRSLPSEWNTHVLVWKNKPDLDTMSIDDLYNNFKIVEQEVKRTASSDSSSQNTAFVSSPSTNNLMKFILLMEFQSYNVVPPPATLVYNIRRYPPPKIDLSYSGLEEFKQPQFKSYGPKSCEIESTNANENIPNELKEYLDAPLVKDRVSYNTPCFWVIDDVNKVT